jgi:UDPglucose--hexose-1-phosphate uridylyltransferase
MVPFYRRQENKVDGRPLLIYGTQPHTLPMQAGPSPNRGDRSSHLRWHPLRQEWVCYAAHRQDRTFKPPESYCPLCPSSNGGVLTEIPFQTFEVAVFENRFAAFSLQNASVLELPIPNKPAIGQCEVMVYSATHNARWGRSRKSTWS